MRLLILYRPNSEHGRRVEEFAHDFRQRSGYKVSLENVDTRDGWATATLYDIMAYPAILALDNASQLIKDWQGDQLPLFDEVAGYLQEQ